MPKPPLREMKKAKTKINLYRACMELVNDKPYRNVLVDELCEKAEISKATFFNFFPQKEDLLLYSMQIWITRRYIQIQKEGKRGIDAIEYLFQTVHEEAQYSPYGMLSLISFLAESHKIPEAPKFTDIEKALLFQKGDEAYVPADLSLAGMFHRYIEEAKADKRLNNSSPTADLIRVMFTIFYGAFLTAHLVQTDDVKSVYDMHLKQLFK